MEREREREREEREGHVHDVNDFVDDFGFDDGTTNSPPLSPKGKAVRGVELPRVRGG